MKKYHDNFSCFYLLNMPIYKVDFDFIVYERLYDRLCLLMIGLV